MQIMSHPLGVRELKLSELASLAFFFCRTL